MTLEELRLRVMAAFPGWRVFEAAMEWGCVELRVGPPPSSVVVFWDPGSWIVWCANSYQENAARLAIEEVTAHDIIAARRRLQGAEPCSAPTT